jgi:DNA-binding MarR family transcriptional regulator
VYSDVRSPLCGIPETWLTTMTGSRPTEPLHAREPSVRPFAPLGERTVGGDNVGKSVRAVALARLLDQAARGLHSIGHDAEMFPAQWAALRYFASTDPAQCTAMALARFQGLAFGPVSRTVRTLVNKGYLRKAGSAGRGRAELIELTAAGKRLLARDPLEVVREAIEELSEPEKEALASALERTLRAIHARHDGAEAESGNV